MEMKQLQYFVTTVQVGSITRAAEVLYITQPALSRLLRRMEEELTFPLFERKHSGLILTPAGRQMYQCAEQILTTLEEGVRQAKQIAGVDQDAMSIVCAFEEFDNRLVYQFQQHYPTIRVQFSILPPQEALQRLLSDEAGFAILPRMTLPDSIKWTPLIDEEMLLSVGPNHPFSGRKSVYVQELDSCNIVCNDVSYDEETLRATCQQAGIQMQFVFSGNSHDQVGALKYIRNCAMFIPTSALLEERTLSPEGLSIYGAPAVPARVVPHLFHREIGLAFRQTRILRSADLYFITSLKNHYQEMSCRVAERLEKMDA